MGGVRNQFSHFIDMAPTILEATNIPAPKIAYGIDQKPMDGIGMAYTWDAKPDDPTREHGPVLRDVRQPRHLQRRLVRQHHAEGRSVGAVLDAVQDVMDGYKWELYDLTKDWTQNHDLAADDAEQARETQALFMAEASKNHVFPLDNSLAPRMVTAAAERDRRADPLRIHLPDRGQSQRYRAEPGPERLLPAKAEIEVGEDGGDGMLFTQGGSSAATASTS